MPFFNSEAYLLECLQSVQDQIEPVWELIAVNDGSTDASVSVLSAHSAVNTTVKLVNQSNRGAGNARNVGLEMAQGEWVYFLDSDDWIGPTLVSSLAAIAEESSADVVYFEMLNSRENRRSWHRKVGSRTLERKVWRGTDYLLPAIRRGAFRFSPCTQLIRRQFLIDQGIRFPELATGEDVAFSVKVALRAQRVVYTRRQLFYRRLRAGSTTTSTNSIQVLRDALANFVALGELADDFVTNEKASRALAIVRKRLWRHALHRFDSLPEQVRESIRPSNVLPHDIPLAEAFLNATNRGKWERALRRFLRRSKKLEATELQPRRPDL